MEFSLASEHLTYFFEKIDGNRVDNATLIVAFILSFIKAYLRPNLKVISTAFINEVSQATAVVPMVMLCGCSFSSSLLSALLESNKIILSLAGFYLLFFFFGEFFKPEQSKPTKNKNRP